MRGFNTVLPYYMAHKFMYNLWAITYHTETIPILRSTEEWCPISSLAPFSGAREANKRCAASLVDTEPSGVSFVTFLNLSRLGIS